MSGYNEESAVARLAGILALELGASAAEAEMIKSAAALHDVGKQRIDPAILNKPGKLTAQEFEIVKTHTLLGAEMLTVMQGDAGGMAVKIALFHHEHWYDGTGYWGVPARCLPEFVGIAAICDVFIALTAMRCYKQAWPPSEALKYIEHQAGKMFDPKLVRVFIPLARDEPRVKPIFETGKR